MSTKSVRYIGGLDAIDVAGASVAAGDSIDLPSPVADELVARGDFEAVKPTKTNPKES